VFDAKGRLLVGMGPQYRNPKLDTPGDSVIIVSDTDGDGVADKTKVFATGFNCIQSLAWHVRPLRDAVSDVTNIGTGEVAYGRGKCQKRQEVRQPDRGKVRGLLVDLAPWQRLRTSPARVVKLMREKYAQLHT